jgi:hypothetical protein
MEVQRIAPPRFISEGVEAKRLHALPDQGVVASFLTLNDMRSQNNAAKQDDRRHLFSIHDVPPLCFN